MTHETTTFTVAKGKQRNHGDYHIPASIRHLGELPLYRAVAWWGLFRGTLFNRDDVSRAFRIDPRRASGIMNYLSHRLKAEDDIRLEHSTTTDGRRGRLLSIRVLDVASSRMPHRPVPPVRRQADRNHRRDRDMVHWLLTRPAANDAARMARWKAACPVTADEC